MKTLTRSLALLLAGLMLLSLCACASTSAQKTVTINASIPEVGAAPETTPIPAIATNSSILIATPSSTRTLDPTIQKIYDANQLETVLKKHNRVTVTVSGYNEKDEVNYFRVLEISNLENGGYYVRIHHESPAGTAEMEGTSAMGYIACERDNGTLEAACSLPGEFLLLAQEAYLDAPYMTAYSNVTATEDSGKTTVLANMTYVGDSYPYDETFVVDSASFELLSMTERAHGETNSSRKEYSLVYDTPYSFPATSVLSKAVTGNDVVSLTLVYRVPEYNYTTNQVYRISKAFNVVVDSRGYYMICPSADMNPTTKVDSISLTGDATYYVNLTTYQTDVEAVMRAGGTSAPTPYTPAPTPLPTAVPAPTAAPVPTPTPQQGVYVTKSPTSETCYVGGKAVFIAYADFCTNTTWMLLSPDGGTKLLAADAPNYFGTVGVFGLGTDTLTLTSIPKSMNGWRVLCSFDGFHGPAVTDTATITVLDKPVPTPPPPPTPAPIPTPQPIIYQDTVYATEGVSNAGFANRIVQATGWYNFYCETYAGETFKVYILPHHFDDADRYISQTYNPSLTMTGVSNASLWLDAGTYVYINCDANDFTGNTPSGSSFIRWTSN